ncbi:DUF4843 domain-containing protein [uncultured Polaribacter sp.]|uniref:DUF4843 domain-containing protein n=1 Tax=uncultured Polaribacter sp. TaxID=174711 RepID=UPI0026322D12|nr:DUF4843 domain-containing protein [uncultured Polaribacter sp.]
MKKIKYILQGILLITFVIFTTRCTQDEIETFKGNTQITFVPSTINAESPFAKAYSFLGNTTGEHIEELEVEIVGNAVDFDRFFNAKVVAGDDTTASENQYEILEGVIKANEFRGKLPVKLLNSDALDSETVSIEVELTDSEDFTAGIVESDHFVLSWTNQIVVPSWRYYRFFFTSVASTNAYRIIVETTGVKVFDRSDFSLVGVPGATALGTQFGDYVKQYNLDNPGNPLLHDDGDLAGEEIVPRYYTKTKFD